MGLARWYGTEGSPQTTAFITSRTSSAVVCNNLFLMKLELKPVKLYKRKGEEKKTQAPCFKSCLLNKY